MDQERDNYGDEDLEGPAGKAVRPTTAAVGRGQKKRETHQQCNDDIDDLDDLLGGGGDSNNQNEFGQTLDEHDFFVSSKNDEFDEPKRGRGKKKDQNDDPLAFLQRAQQEKQTNAEKQAQMEMEAEAAFKGTEELAYNLFCPYMDQEDKWKKSIG